VAVAPAGLREEVHGGGDQRRVPTGGALLSLALGEGRQEPPPLAP